MSTVKAPAGLEAAGRKFWRQVTEDYELRPDDLAVLREACRTLDTLDRLQEAVADSPVLVEGSTGQARVNTLLPEVRGQRLALAAMLRQLGLPDEDEGEQGADVPEGMERQRTRSEIASLAASARWRRGRRGA